MTKETRTFLLSDVEKSTQLSEQYGGAIDAIRRRHVGIIRQAVEANGGHLYKTIGDGTQSAFENATQALAAAVAAQLGHYKEEGDLALRSRMALHTCQVDYDEQEDDYDGVALNRAARLMAAGHGGQILISRATYEQLRYHLPEGVALIDLGEHRLKDLTEPEQIFQATYPELPTDFPRLRTVDRWPNNLPAQTTPLIGREKELVALKELVRQEHVRLVTLTGTGGTGKTRLALQLAADTLDDFKDGVWFVNLAPITDPALVIPTITQALGVKENPGQPLIDTLKGYLKERHLLLFLDNFEQLITSATRISELLAACPYLKLLVTSRIALRLRGEHEYSVPPLDLPDPAKLPSLEKLAQFEAIRLFIERAQEVKPDFELDGQNAPDIAQICARLDGLPLAIELAAARVRLLPPHAMLPRLQRRLKMLTGGARDLPARQQTIRNTIAWSYDLLDYGEKELFRRLAAFQGGRSLEAIEAVCNASGDLPVDAVDGVESLVSKSLLQQREGVGGEPRLVMLETIHEFAREKLQEAGEAKELARQHALYFLSLAESAEPHITARPEPEWLNLLDQEYDNLRAALAWAKGETDEGRGEPDVALRLASALWRFWFRRGYVNEGREQLRGVLDFLGEKGVSHGGGEADNVPPTLSKKAYSNVLQGAGVQAHLQGDFLSAKTFYEQGLAIRRELGEKLGTATLLSNVATVEFELGDLGGAQRKIEEALQIFREIGDKNDEAIALNNLGNLTMDAGDYSRARALYEESLALRQASNDRWGIATSLHNLGNLTYEQGDYAGARALQEESLAIRHEVGDRIGSIAVLNELGHIAREERDYAGAQAFHEEALSISRELKNKPRTAMSLQDLGVLAHQQGDYTSARALFNESLDLLLEMGDRKGAAQAIEASAHLALEEGDYDRAEALYRESLAARRDLAHKPGLAASFTGLAAVAARRAQEAVSSESGGREVASSGQAGIEEATRGARLLGAADKQVEATRPGLERIKRAIYEQSLSALREVLGEAEYRKAREEGLEMALDEAISYALERSESRSQPS